VTDIIIVAFQQTRQYFVLKLLKNDECHKKKNWISTLRGKQGKVKVGKGGREMRGLERREEKGVGKWGMGKDGQ